MKQFKVGGIYTGEDRIEIEVVKRTKQTITNPDNRIRLEIEFNSYEEAKEALRALEAGEKELRDYKENFRSYSNEGGNVYMNFKE